MDFYTKKTPNPSRTQRLNTTQSTIVSYARRRDGIEDRKFGDDPWFNPCRQGVDGVQRFTEVERQSQTESPRSSGSEQPRQWENKHRLRNSELWSDQLGYHHLRTHAGEVSIRVYMGVAHPLKEQPGLLRSEGVYRNTQ